MKTPLAIILSLTLTGLGPAQEAPKEFEKLETKSGKVYDHVKVRKVEPDGISIMHDAGTAASRWCAPACDGKAGAGGGDTNQRYRCDRDDTGDEADARGGEGINDPERQEMGL